MILPDYEINKWASGHIDPYTPENINPASIDLRLGDRISTPRWYWRNPVTRFCAWHLFGKPDPKKLAHFYWNSPQVFYTHTLWPGQFVLCHSFETTDIPDHLAVMLLSKSSTGRIGLEHLHAGFGDPGFGKNGGAQWTWELCNLAPWPIELKAGQRLTQLVFFEMNGIPEKSYDQTGRYQGQRGPTPARRDFR
jgi:dCTP deaminase